jgi:hypothetical protein
MTHKIRVVRLTFVTYRVLEEAYIEAPDTLLHEEVEDLVLEHVESDELEWTTADSRQVEITTHGHNWKYEEFH